jgi:3-oxoacyl-[acyl-carrier protein] reductase
MLLYAVNVKAPFFLTQRLLDRIADNGRVINISSGLSQVAHPDKIAYGMTKAALNAFTRSLAKVVGARGITANAITPGVVATDMNPWADTPQGAEALSGRSALGRVGRPEDIAGLVALLAGPDSQWSTGAVIDASGGANI